MNIFEILFVVLLSIVLTYVAVIVVSVHLPRLLF